ncbi:PREDICTED: uncharacterized protein LOC108780125 [Cyphomyrmex costatus]|uniref:uncharacterized protein LOC108780125 n=1 Tax=Cyphomyrmex costatus TaxID=456900 RepID=UPI0008522B07|nr:PREDICTED: uncharacterized protein LOC108780125 [Cyphomyrmex costatus]
MSGNQEKNKIVEEEVIDWKSTSWIYKLSKIKLIQVLCKFQTIDTEFVFDENDNIDKLRKIASEFVTSRNRSDKNSESDEKSTDNNNDRELSDTDNADNNKNKSNEEILSISRSKLIHEMAGSKVKLDFNLGTDDWELYTERLELYFTANDIEEEKQVPVLLTKVSADTYKLIKDLCAPTKPKDKTFDQLVKLVKDHLCPKPSEAMERCKFHQTQQAATETISEFVARLKSMATHCSFVDLSSAMCDQLVCGLRNHAIKAILFREEKLTFDRAFKLATAAESAEKNATSTNQSPNSEIHALSYQRPKFQRGRSAYRGRGKGRGNRGGAQQAWRGQQQAEQSNCYCCGQPNHFARNCTHRYDTCNFCKRRGHIEAACRNKQTKVLKVEQNGREEEDEESASNFDSQSTVNELYTVYNEETPVQMNATIYNVGIPNDEIVAKPMFIQIKINNVNFSMEIDSGAYVTVMSKETKDCFFPNLEIKKLNKRLNGYGNVELEHDGVIDNLNVEYKNKKQTLGLVVMKRPGTVIIGRQWLKAFGLWPLTLNRNAEGTNTTINKVDESNIKVKLTNKFSQLFGAGVGIYNKGTLKLVLKNNATPVALKARKLPFALMPKVEEEIDRLVSLGHLEKVDVSEWATPIIPVIKKNGTIRICGNFKLTVNPQLVIDRHPIPLIDEIFSAMGKGKTFSQIDLEHAYMQIPVDEASRNYLTIITHKGLFRYTKLTEGIASGPGDFQKKIEQCLTGIPGCVAYLDNIFVTGQNEKEHVDTLYKVCTRLQQYGFKVNINKCEFFREKIEILGYVIDKGGLHKSNDKVRAIVEAPHPTNFKQLESFIGLVTYYARFLPDRANKLKALYECAKQSKFTWTPDCEKAFIWVKKEIISPRILAHYDPSKQLVLACDASAYGLSAVLSLIDDDNLEKPIAFASKIIPVKEKHRATIDKEAGAIVFGFKKFYNFIYGREIILKTDHKPLIYIFGPKQEIPLTVASRLQRWAYFLSRFTYKIIYIKSKDNGNCDALSRLPVTDSLPIFDNEFTAINYMSENLDTLNAVDIANETKKDKMLKKVLYFAYNEWPNTNDPAIIDNAIFMKKDELTVEKGCILWGYRVLVPESLREIILRELHASHFGIVKMKMIARSYVWWPGIDKDLENVAASCTICTRLKKSPSAVPLTPWPWPDKFWSRVHSDFLGPFHGHMFMLIIDAHSKWPEVIDMNTCTQASRVISEFQKIFTRFGLPRHLVTDNGPQYTSTEFRKFLRINGVKHSFSAPHHPATNGAAENFVGIFKDKVEKIMKSGKTLNDAIDLFLFDYRATEHCTTGRSPAWMVSKRELRTRFDMLRPSVEETVVKKQTAQILAHKGSRKVSFNVGDVVMVNDYSVRNDKRREGRIVRKLSPVTYEVEVGDIAAKHFKHLRDTFQKERKKILTSIPPSGAGSESKRYESTWEYYNDLLFLAEHVTSRKTISNYSGCSETSLASDNSLCFTDEVHLSHNLLKRKASQLFVIELQQEELKPEGIVYSSPSTSLQSVSLYDTSDNESLLSDVNESNMISCPNESLLLNPTIEAQTSAKMSSTIRGKAIKSILQPKVPKSDVIKKEKDQDVIKSCIQQLSKSASEVAAKIVQLTETTNDELKFLQYLLKYVPEDKKLLCFSDICRVAEIYRKGGCPNIIEQKQD